ncbi:hypothetical protein D9M70_359380 [compost metagenome]
MHWERVRVRGCVGIIPVRPNPPQVHEMSDEADIHEPEHDHLLDNDDDLDDPFDDELDDEAGGDWDPVDEDDDWIPLDDD